ncbi:AAA family ATPase [Streptomyces anulatus]|uniref:helix-turn-helix transcriptional regulator n=1 Tax=Streptomyces anulatus TaxID=1892 RepID=UPI003701D059
MELIGMDEQLEIVLDMARTGGNGPDRTFLLVGPPGSGKTTLLNVLAQKLGEGRVLIAAGSAAERDIELGVLRQLMAHAALPGAAGQLVERMVGRDRPTPSGPAWLHGPPGPVVHRPDARLLDELCHLLAKESEHHPLVIVIDDAHEADEESLAALTYLQRRFRLGRIVFVLARLTPPAGRFDIDGAVQLTGKRLVLSPLSPAAVESVVAARLGRAWADAHAAEVDEITGGNPGLVTALVDDLAIAWRRRLPAGRVLVGEMFTQTCLTYLHRFDAPTVAMAYRLALCEKHLTGATSTAAFLAAAMPAWADHVDRAIDELERAGLLYDGRFRHPAVRAAVEGTARRWAAEAGEPGGATGPHPGRTPTGPFDHTPARPRPHGMTRVGGRPARDRHQLLDQVAAMAGPAHSTTEAALYVRAPAMGGAEAWYDDAPPCPAVEEPRRDDLFERFVPLVLRCADEQASRLHESPTAAGRRQALAGEAGRLVRRAEAERRRGEVREAAAMIDAALRMLPAREWGPALAGPLSVGGAANTAMGELARAEDHLRSAAVEPLLETDFGLRLLWAAGQYKIARGQPDEALDMLFRCGQLMLLRGVDLPDLAAWRTSAAEAQIMLGNHRMARSLAEMELGRAGRDAPHTWGRALRVLASISPLQDRLVMLEESVRSLGDSGDLLEVAHSLRALARVYDLTGSADEAKAAQTRALALARSCGVQLLAEKPFSGESDGPPKPLAAQADALTEAERKVATLAARGHTNREIGKNLFITMSTVEQHLTRIYRKLDVPGRAALIPLLTGGIDQRSADTP